MTSKPLLRSLRGEILDRPPVWLMRQAGRYLPEYRRIRATKTTFLEFCYAPDLAAEATLQPIRRFHLDGAILFSDILVIPDSLGQKVTFEAGAGPRLDPVTSSLSGLAERANMNRLEPVFETLRRVKLELPDSVALIGFCGAPWTVASYMIAGQGGSDQQAARLFMYREPSAFSELIDLLVRSSIDYLKNQVVAGAEVLQIFDSWAGALPAALRLRWCVEPLARIVRGVRTAFPTTPIIAFPRGAGSTLPVFGQVPGLSALALDSGVDPSWASEALDRSFPVQGNIDPIALVAGGAALDASIDECLAAFASRPHVMNLGHGVLPETPVSHVEHLVRRVRQERA